MSLQVRDSDDGQINPVNSSNNKLEIANFLWDTDTLQWVRETAGTASGPAANVAVTSTTGLTDTQLRSAPVPVTFAESEFTSRVDDLGSTIYIGKAVVGSSESSGVWSIKRITFSGALTTTLWAGGSSSFSYHWSTRHPFIYQ